MSNPEEQSVGVTAFFEWFKEQQEDEIVQLLRDLLPARSEFLKELFSARWRCIDALRRDKI